MSISNENSTTPESEKDLGQTPFWLIRSIESLVGTEFDLDVCCLKKTAKAKNYFSLEEDRDCFTTPWVGNAYGPTLAWCNPPFSNVMPFIERAVDQCDQHGTTTIMIIPNNPEVAYRRKLKEVCDTFVEMPFRLKFLRPDGTKFLDKKGTEQTPKFSCAVGIITPLGLKAPSRVIEYDFRTGFYEK
jgi:phage N-6-adenine-methyltransferase